METDLAIGPMTRLSNCSVSSTQAMVWRREAFEATNGSPARTDSTIASSRLRTASFGQHEQQRQDHGDHQPVHDDEDPERKVSDQQCGERRRGTTAA